MTSDFQPHESLLATYETGLMNHATHLEPILRDLGALDNVTTVLSVGVGSGVLECKLAKRQSWTLSYVEPSTPMANAMKRNIEQFGIQSNVAEAFLCTFEELTTSNKYDLILSLDSWYRIGCNRSHIEKALNLRTGGGKLLIQLLTRQHQLYWALDHTRGLISSDELSCWAIDQGLQHTYIEHTHRIAVSNLLSGEQPTKVYEHFIEFALGRAWDDLESDARLQAVNAVHSLQDDGFVYTHYGYLIFDKPNP